jgi:hypothetical protein
MAAVEMQKDAAHVPPSHHAVEDSAQHPTMSQSGANPPKRGNTNSVLLGKHALHGKLDRFHPGMDLGHVHVSRS